MVNHRTADRGPFRFAYLGIRVCLTVLAVALISTSATHVRAAGPELQKVIDYAKENGVQVIVVSPEEKAKAASPPPASGLEDIGKLLADLKHRCSEVLANLGSVPADFSAALARASSQDGIGLVAIVAIITGLMFLAHLLERLYLRWLQAKINEIWPTTPPDVPGRMTVVLTRFAGRAGGVVLFAIAALILAALVLSTDGVTELTAVALIGTVALVRLLVEFWRVWLSPLKPAYRLAAIDDEGAGALFQWLAGSAMLGVGLGALVMWFGQFGLARHTLTSLVLVSATAMLIYHLSLVAANRKRVAAIISGAKVGPPSLPRLTTFMASSWHLLVSVYFLAAWATTVIRIVLDRPNALGLSAGMIAVLMAALALYGVGIVIINCLFHRRQAAHADDSGAGEPSDETTEAEDDQPATVPTLDDSYERLARRAFAMVVVAFALGATLYLWGANPLDDASPVVRLWDVIFVAIIGYVIYQLAKISMGRKIAEQEELEQADLESKGALSGLSRLATLLPLFRNFALATIAVITVMIAMSGLGVDIAPLFAGAGIVGLAVGFGAQTMVKDIISGAFFLADDAFRIGEYIDTGDASGTVEKIAIRSMQVRHPEGWLQTVPFGEIKIVTNWSRDWSLMKLKLRVPYDTDVERVRRLIKKLGKELLEDPDIGHMFLQPLKSQGVHSIDDSAMIIRVKFTTRPGDQYVVRTKVYTRIQDLFAREGIQFATRQVTVRLADEDKGRELDDETKKKIAGAVLPTADQGAARKTESAADL